MRAPEGRPAGIDATYKRLMWRIIPFLMLLYFINYLDRVNIGFAKLQFMGDLGLNEAQYGLATGLFFLTYSLLEIPSNLMANRIGVRKTLLRIMVAWGLLTMVQMTIRTAEHLYLLRLLFGAAEAGFFPCILLYMSRWFPNAYRGRVISLLMMSIPISAIIGAPISGGIMQHLDGFAGLRGWQWLFVLEGIPAVALGIGAFLYLDETPRDARWLDAQAKDRIERDLAADEAAAGAGLKASFADALRDPRIHAIAFLNLAVNGGTNAVNFWMPTILKASGVADLGRIGWIAAVISVVSAVAMVLVGRSSDRRDDRRWHFALGGLVGAAGFLLLPLARGDLGLTITVLGIAALGNLCALAMYWTIPTSYLEGRGTAGGFAYVNTIGAIGSGLSPTVVGYFRVQTGELYTGLAVVAATLVLAVIVALVALPSQRVRPALAAAPV